MACHTNDESPRHEVKSDLLEGGEATPLTVKP